MIYNVVIVKRANIHLVKIIEWCEKDYPGLEIKFLKSLNLAIKDIQKNPIKYQIVYNEVRIKYFKSIKFSIHYTVKNNLIYILGIFHTNQDSKNW